MTYSLLQSDGDYIGPLATISGYGALLRFIKSPQGTKYTSLRDFVDNGYTDKPDKVAKEAQSCASSSPSRDLEEILNGISTRLKGKSGRIVIGDV